MPLKEKESKKRSETEPEKVEKESTSSPPPSPSKGSTTASSTTASSTTATVNAGASHGRDGTKSSSPGSKTSQIGTDDAQKTMDEYHAEFITLLECVLRGKATKRELAKKILNMEIPDPSVPKSPAVAELKMIFEG